MLFDCHPTEHINCPVLDASKWTGVGQIEFQRCIKMPKKGEQRFEDSHREENDGRIRSLIERKSGVPLLRGNGEWFNQRKGCGAYLAVIE